MSTFFEILAYIVETLGGLFLVFVILRFLLQLARADYYNPISQSVQKITNPLLIPIRRVIPGIFGIDFAAIILALAVQMTVGEIIYFLLTQQFINPVQLLIWAIIGTLNVVTYIGLGCILVLVITSFVAPHSRHPAIMLVHQLIDPVLIPIRKIIPAVGGLDFSVMFVGMGIFIVQKVLLAVAQTTGLLPPLIIGF